VGKVIFEMDCINLKSALSSIEHYFGSMGIHLSDMKFRLHMCFIDACVVFALRGCNKLAHKLAALGIGVAQGDHVTCTTSYRSSLTRLVTGDRVVSQ
jgi:hypothetical protein